MDTRDVSKVTDYLPYLRKQKRTLQTAQSRKGQRPKVTKSRNEIIMQFMFRQMMSSNRPTDTYNIHSSFVPPAYHPCITRFSDLKRAMIKDLLLETHHRGRYALLRVVTPTDTMTAVMVVVEDEEDNVIMLQLYNQGKDLCTDGRLGEGTVLIVKEPYLKVMADGEVGIRVDHLSDVNFLPDHDSRIPPRWRRAAFKSNDTSSDHWRTKGNDFFNEARYQLAITCYTKALDISSSTEESLVIRLNRALTFLKSQRFEAALSDLEVALQCSETSEKALFRKSQALYYLQRFRESCDTYEILRKEYPDNVAALEGYDRAIARLSEQKSGIYQFKSLQKAAKRLRPPRLSHATYVGPVTVKPTQSCGRGLFTTDHVKAGDLLFCEKAFAHAFHDADDPNQGLSLLMNPQTNSMTVGTQSELIGLLAQKLEKNPSLIPTFTDLYHGTYEPVNVSEIDGLPVVDTFLIERIMSLNCFGCPLSTRQSHISGQTNETQPSASNKQFDSCGIWCLASYINHSCVSNARRAFIGDMMIVRASQDLPPNSEITFWYKSPLDEDLNGQQVDLQHWGFKCTCVICKDLASTNGSELAKRDGHRADLRKAFRAHKGPNATKVEAILSKMAETYAQPPSEVPHLSLWDAYLSLAMVCASQDKLTRAADFAVKALESLGYIVEGARLPHTPGTPLRVKKWGLVVDSLVGCWMNLSGVYLLAAPDLAAQAENYARLTYKICIGEDETFDATYSRSSLRPDGLLVGAK